MADIDNPIPNPALIDNESDLRRALGMLQRIFTKGLSTKDMSSISSNDLYKLSERFKMFAKFLENAAENLRGFGR